jgi:hypothetical protein
MTEQNKARWVSGPQARPPSSVTHSQNSALGHDLSVTWLLGIPLGSPRFQSNWTWHGHTVKSCTQCILSYHKWWESLPKSCPLLSTSVILIPNCVHGSWGKHTSNSESESVLISYSEGCINLDFLCSFQKQQVGKWMEPHRVRALDKKSTSCSPLNRIFRPKGVSLNENKRDMHQERMEQGDWNNSYTGNPALVHNHWPKTVLF